MTTDNSRTQIFHPRTNNVEKRNSSKDQTVLEKSLDEMEDEVKKVLMTIINLVINSGNAEAMVKHMWKALRATVQQNSTEIIQLRLINGTVEA
jgi:hypothetical protein